MAEGDPPVAKHTSNGGIWGKKRVKRKNRIDIYIERYVLFSLLSLQLIYSRLYGSDS